VRARARVYIFHDAYFKKGYSDQKYELKIFLKEDGK